MATRPGALAGARIAGERFVRSRRQQNPEGRMPLLDHLRELRNRVVKMALALAAGMTAGFIFFSQAWHVIERPLCAPSKVLGRSLSVRPGRRPPNPQRRLGRHPERTSRQPPADRRRLSCMFSTAPSSRT